MKRQLSKKSKIAVLITAILLCLILFLLWTVLAVVTVNEISAEDYQNYSRTELVASFDTAIADGRYGGVIIDGSDQSLTEKATTARSAGKTIFITLPVDREQALSATDGVLDVTIKSRVFFCSSDRELLEKLYEEKNARCILIVKTGTGAMLGATMGYNCALDVKKITEKRVEKAHEKGHFVIATNVYEEDIEQCRIKRIDYAVVGNF